MDVNEHKTINFFSEFQAVFWLVFLLVMAARANAAPPTLSEPVIADVTDRSFSVIWTSDQPGQPVVDVYSDATGTAPVSPGVTASPYNVHTGNPALDETSRQSSIDTIITDAKSYGIFQVTVSGLAPFTQYFIKYGVRADLTSETTKCPDSGVSSCPDTNTTLLTVTTEKNPGRVNPSVGLFLNDLILDLNANAVPGELAIVGAETAHYPVSAFVGDGISAPYAVIDPNNFYMTSGNTSLMLVGSSVKGYGDTGEGLVVRYYKGTNGSETKIKAVGVNQKHGVLTTPNGRKYGDCNNDNIVNNYDHLLLRNVIAGNIQESDYSSVAFHPIFCNLYKEDGLNSVVTKVVLDSNDQSRLESLLVGKINYSSLPEAP